MTATVIGAPLRHRSTGAAWDAAAGNATAPGARSRRRRSGRVIVMTTCSPAFSPLVISVLPFAVSPVVTVRVSVGPVAVPSVATVTVETPLVVVTASDETCTTFVARVRRDVTGHGRPDVEVVAAGSRS